MSLRDEMKKDVGESLPGIRWETMGEWVVGTLLDVPERIEFDQDGKTKKCWIVNIDVADVGPSCLWLDKPALLSAVLEANPGEFTVGDTLAVRWSGEKDTGKPSKQKLFEAKYKPAPKSVSSSDMTAEDPFA